MVRDIGRYMAAIRDGTGSAPLLFGIGFAFLYGVVHTLGPGHGKMVVASYFVGRDAQVWRPAQPCRLAQNRPTIASVLPHHLVCGIWPRGMKPVPTGHVMALPMPVSHTHPCHVTFYTHSFYMV
jgi:hypothetical protein